MTPSTPKTPKAVTAVFKNGSTEVASFSKIINLKMPNQTNSRREKTYVVADATKITPSIEGDNLQWTEIGRASIGIPLK